VYIIQSKVTRRFYTGSTENLYRRIHEHNSRQTKSTKNGSPWELVHVETFPDKKSAQKREAQIKREKSHSYIERYILNKSAPIEDRGGQGFVGAG